METLRSNQSIRNMTNKEIARCVRKAQAGCHKSFGRLITHHESKIRGIIGGSLRSYRKEDMEDMYQEVLLHIWRNIKSKNKDAHFTAWLIVLTKWRCATMKRKRLPPGQYDFRLQDFEKIYDWQRISSVLFVHEKSFMDVIFTREAINYVKCVMRKLNKEDRGILKSRFWLEDTQTELSKQLGICVMTCRRKRKKAIGNCRQALLQMVTPEDLCAPS